MEQEPDKSKRDWETLKNERNLFGVGISLLLLLSSLLYVGYVELKDTWLGITISSIGLISSIIGTIYVAGFQQRIKNMEKALKVADMYQTRRPKLRKQQWVAIWLSFFLVSIWLPSLIFSIISVFFCHPSF